MKRPVKVFIWSAPEDERFCIDLEKHLRPLEKGGQIECWSARRIAPGASWQDERARRLAEADLVLLLISSDFLTEEHEPVLEAALARHTDEKIRVVPVLLRPSMWTETALGGLMPLPRDRRPIADWPSSDAAWIHVVQELELAPGIEPGSMSLATAEGARAPLAMRVEVDTSLPSVCLWVHGWQKIMYKLPPTVELDWTSYFDVRSRRVPTAEQWRDTLEKELEGVKEIFSAVPGGNYIDFRGKVSLTAALVLGMSFPAAIYGFRVEQPTQGETFLWRSFAPPSDRRLEIADEQLHAEGDDLLVVFSITGDAKPAVVASLGAEVGLFRGIVVAIPEGGPSDRAIASEHDAVALVTQARELIKGQKQKHAPRRIHLVLYAPLGFCLFLGQRLNALGEIVAYERSTDGAYQAAVTLLTR